VATEEAKAKEAVERARKDLAKRRAAAEERDLADASELLKQIERGAKEVENLAKLDRAEATAKLNDLAKRLADRRDQLGGAEALRKRMNEAKDFGRGPAEKAADALRRGDWKQATEELTKLQKKLEGGAASPDEQKRLGAQLDKMRDKLAQAAGENAAAQQELQKQLAEAQRKGDLAQGAKLQEKLDALAQQAPAMAQLEKAAQQMADAQKALEQGDAKQAAKELAKLAENIDELAAQAAEMEMLDAAMSDLQACKDGMCDKPGAGGDPGNQDGGVSNDGAGGPSSNWGYGRGPRDGRDPVDSKDPRYRDSQVKQEVKQGSSTFGGLVDGPSIKGQVSEGIKAELTSENVAPADPLTSERLPRSRREHAEEYFRKLREEL
jgi:chemotaxis protein histidine kinase CheA